MMSNARLQSPTVLQDKLSYGDDDVTNVCFGHRRVNRQGYDSLKNPAGLRKIRRLIAELVPVKRMEMERDEMNRRSDVFALKGF